MISYSCNNYDSSPEADDPAPQGAARRGPAPRRRAPPGTARLDSFRGRAPRKGAAIRRSSRGCRRQTAGGTRHGAGQGSKPSHRPPLYSTAHLPPPTPLFPAYRPAPPPLSLLHKPPGSPARLHPAAAAAAASPLPAHAPTGVIIIIIIIIIIMTVRKPSQLGSAKAKAGKRRAGRTRAPGRSRALPIISPYCHHDQLFLL